MNLGWLNFLRDARQTKVQECDATGDAQREIAKYIKY